jgi:hypothetical protein
MVMISFLLLSVGAATNPDFCHTLLPASGPLFSSAESICQVSERDEESIYPTLFPVVCLAKRQGEEKKRQERGRGVGRREQGCVWGGVKREWR